jgi:hypothetical protein
MNTQIHGIHFLFVTLPPARFGLFLSAAKGENGAWYTHENLTEDYGA